MAMLNNQRVKRCNFLSTQSQEFRGKITIAVLYIEGLEKDCTKTRYPKTQFFKSNIPPLKWFLWKNIPWISGQTDIFNDHCSYEFLDVYPLVI